MINNQKIEKDAFDVNLWQHPLWATFQKSIGRKVWQLEVEGASALVVCHSMSLGLNWLEIPRGPLFKDEKSLEAILQKIRALGKKEKSIFIRFSSYIPFKAKNLKFKITTEDHHPETSLIIDLAQSDEDILKQMKPKGRYNIKLAQKHEVEVQASDDVKAFHSLLVKTGGRDGFGIHPESYYQKMLDNLRGHAQLLLAKKGGQVIAGGIFTYLDGMAIYYYGASDHSARKFMAPYLVQWMAIKEAKKQGCLQYDFLGIAPEGAKNHAWAGVTSFKKKFGGSVVSYPPAKDLVLRPLWYFVYQMRKKMS